MFSILCMLLLCAIVCMLVYESSTLRDILFSRMKGFTHRLFFDILSDTLLTIDAVGILNEMKNA